MYSKNNSYPNDDLDDKFVELTKSTYNKGIDKIIKYLAA